MERHASGWAVPALRLVFYLSFVLLAAYAGAVADALPKGRVMLLSSLVKFTGCGLLFLQVHPLLAYALIGLGAAAYGPARFGILPELLTADELVKANAWVEVSTVLSILFGVVLGSFLMDQRINFFAGPAKFLTDRSQATSATLLISLLYLVAVAANAAIPLTPASNPAALLRLNALPRQFNHAVRRLWSDPAAQISLSVTSLFWAVSATLQFLILRWAEQTLRLTLSQAALLQVAVAAGLIAGAVAAGNWIRLNRALSVLPLGLALSFAVMLMAWVQHIWLASILLIIIGMLSGLFLIPMNALLQQRGYSLMHPGQSIAVQNYCENLASLTLLAFYGLMIYLNTPILPIIIGLGVLVGVGMGVIMMRNRQHRLSARQCTLSSSVVDF